MKLQFVATFLFVVLSGSTLIGQTCQTDYNSTVRCLECTPATEVTVTNFRNDLNGTACWQYLGDMVDCPGSLCGSVPTATMTDVCYAGQCGGGGNRPSKRKPSLASLAKDSLHLQTAPKPTSSCLRYPVANSDSGPAELLSTEITTADARSGASQKGTK
jgi:hypothetical protein